MLCFSGHLCKRYSVCSESGDLIFNETALDQSYARDKKNSRSDYPADRDVVQVRVNSCVPAPPPIHDTSGANRSRSSYLNNQPSFSRSSEESFRTTLRNRYQCQSVEEIPSPLQLSAEREPDLDPSLGDERSIEIQTSEGEMFHNSSQPHFNSSTDIIYAVRTLNKLRREWMQEDTREISCGREKGRANIGDPQLASSADVSLPIPSTLRVASSAREGSRGSHRRERSALGNDRIDDALVNRPLRGNIKAKTIGNPYALLDEDDSHREEVIQAQLARFYRNAVEGGVAEKEVVCVPSPPIPGNVDGGHSFPLPFGGQHQEKKSVREKHGRKVGFFNESDHSAVNKPTDLAVPQPPSREDGISHKYQRQYPDGCGALHVGELQSKKKNLIHVFPSMALYQCTPSRPESIGKIEEKDSVVSENSTVQCETPMHSTELALFPSAVDSSQCFNESEAGSQKNLEVNPSESFKRQAKKSRDNSVRRESFSCQSNSWQMPFVEKQVGLLSYSSDTNHNLSSNVQPQVATVTTGNGSTSSHQNKPNDTPERFPQLPKYFPLPVSSRGTAVTGVQHRRAAPVPNNNRYPQTARDSRCYDDFVGVLW